MMMMRRNKMGNVATAGRSVLLEPKQTTMCQDGPSLQHYWHSHRHSSVSVQQSQKLTSNKSTFWRSSNCRSRDYSSNQDDTILSSRNHRTATKSTARKITMNYLDLFLLSPTKTKFSNILQTIQKFQNGISKLKSDFFTSLHIQEAELTRLHLQRKLHGQFEERRMKLRQHEKHGIRIVDEDGKEIKSYYYFSSSNSYDSRHENNIATIFHWNRYYQSHYLSTRRPQEHLRQISRDLQTTLPTVAGFVLIPFVGYAFLALGVMFPRWLLSRQFHSWEQRWEFATKEYGERRKWFKGLNEDFWASCMRSMPQLVLSSAEDATDDGGDDSGKASKGGWNDNNDSSSLDRLVFVEFDSAGPVLDRASMKKLYKSCQTICNNDKKRGVLHDNIHIPMRQGGDESPFLYLPTSHLHSLSLSSNLSSSIFLPSTTIAPWFLRTFLPSRYLHRRLKRLAEDIIVDDLALLEEGQLENYCEGMTEDEILDACWLRGLPVGRYANRNNYYNREESPAIKIDSDAITQKNVDVDVQIHEISAMRKIFCNYLKMVQLVADEGERPRGVLVRDSALQLLVLQLPAIRNQMDQLDSKYNIT